MVNENETRNPDAAGTKTPKVNWDDSQMKTTYANVCNASSTREEVTLLFGTNQSWYSGNKEVTVKLSDRIILSPYAAKRLVILLTSVVGEYEKRFGELKIDFRSGKEGETLSGCPVPLNTPREQGEKFHADSPRGLRPAAGCAVEFR